MPAPSPFVGIAEEERVFEARVAMDRGQEYVVAVIEDRLAAVAVVVIDIKDRHPRGTLIEKRLGGNGHIVQIAVTTHQITGSVVARRTTEGKGAAGTVADQLLGAQGDLRRAVNRLPGAGRDRGAAIEAVITKLAMQVVRQLAAQGARRPGKGQQVALRVAVSAPACPGSLQELQIGIGVDAGDRRQTKVLRDAYLAQPPILNPLQHMLGSRGHFKTGFEFTVDKFAAAVVQVMVIAVESQHVAAPRKCLGSIVATSRSREKQQFRPKWDRCGQY
jgi:hypothetical protein